MLRLFVLMPDNITRQKAKVPQQRSKCNGLIAQDRHSLTFSAQALLLKWFRSRVTQGTAAMDDLYCCLLRLVILAPNIKIEGKSHTRQGSKGVTQGTTAMDDLDCCLLRLVILPPDELQEGGSSRF